MYYKVVRLGPSGKMVSAFSVYYDINYTKLVYDVGKTTHPRFGDGGIAIFDNIDNARSFAKKNSSLIVYECEAEIIPCGELSTRFRSSGFCDSSGSINTIVDNVDIEVDGDWCRAIPLDIPQGTLVAKWIKLIREISNEDKE